MELAPGARLGPYEVFAPLGAGGMGEVWLADGRRLVTRDTRAIELLDTATGEARRLVKVGGFTIGASVGPGDRSITCTETGTEGNHWLAELE